LNDRISLPRRGENRFTAREFLQLVGVSALLSAAMVFFLH
jgi:hypothetical protein